MFLETRSLYAILTMLELELLWFSTNLTPYKSFDFIFVTADDMWCIKFILENILLYATSQNKR